MGVRDWGTGTYSSQLGIQGDVPRKLIFLHRDKPICFLIKWPKSEEKYIVGGRQVWGRESAPPPPLKSLWQRP